MEYCGKFIPPYAMSFEKEPEDIDRNGELTEQGERKTEQINKLLEKMKRFDEVSLRKFEICKKIHQDYFSLGETECQDNLKSLLIKHKREVSFSQEDQFKKFSLMIDLSEKASNDLLADLLLMRIPNIYSLEISHISKKDIDNVKIFLEKSFPHSLNTLIFNFADQPKWKKDLLDLDKFIDLLVKKYLNWITKIFIKKYE